MKQVKRSNALNRRLRGATTIETPEQELWFAVLSTLINDLEHPLPGYRRDARYCLTNMWYLDYIGLNEDWVLDQVKIMGLV